MLPVTVQTHITAPREQVYDYLVDLAGRVAFADHYLEELRLTSPQSVGQGAGVRFRIRGQWAEIVIVEAVRPHRIAEAGGLGRLGRTRLESRYEISRASAGLTRVELTVATDPAGRLAAMREGLGARGWHRRQAKRALERLRRIFEERPEAPLARSTMAGYEPLTGPRFGVSPVYPGASEHGADGH